MKHCRLLPNSFWIDFRFSKLAQFSNYLKNSDRRAAYSPVRSRRHSLPNIEIFNDDVFDSLEGIPKSQSSSNFSNLSSELSTGSNCGSKFRLNNFEKSHSFINIEKAVERAHHRLSVSQNLAEEIHVDAPPQKAKYIYNFKNIRSLALNDSFSHADSDNSLDLSFRNFDFERFQNAFLVSKISDLDTMEKKHLVKKSTHYFLENILVIA
ncbi:hypothetical protein GEMRC1_010119 [Eukaryota sp. GEM-RC1]